MTRHCKFYRACRCIFFALFGLLFSMRIAYATPPPPYEWHEVELSTEQRGALEQEACAKPYSLKMEYSAASIEEYFSDHHKELWASARCESHRKIERFAVYYSASCKEVSSQWDCDSKSRREQFAAKIYGAEVQVSSSNMTIDEILPIFQFLTRQRDPRSYSPLVARQDCVFNRGNDEKVTAYCAGEHIKLAVDCKKQGKCRYSIFPKKFDGHM